MSERNTIESARRYAEHHGVKPYTEHIFALLALIDERETKLIESTDKVTTIRVMVALAENHGEESIPTASLRAAVAGFAA